MNASITRTVVTLVAVAMVGSLAHAGVHLSRHMMGETPEIAPPNVSVQPRREAKPLDTAPILALAPFGDRVIEGTPAPTQDVPDVSMLTGLKLQGVVVAAPSSRSSALIAGAAPDGKVGTYSIGDEVARGAELIAVRADSVDLALGGFVETLRFGKAEAAPDPLDALSRLRQRSAGIPSGSAGPIGGQTIDEIMDDYRKRIALNPKTVLDGFGVTLAPNGYRVGPNPSSTVTRAGLRPGDLVAKVNGEQVGNLQSDRKLYDRMTASGHARVEILRDGQRVVLSFPLR